eukprot:scaffold1484_cov173-Amphora_coffeaeformis.AAC.32
MGSRADKGALPSASAVRIQLVGCWERMCVIPWYRAAPLPQFWDSATQEIGIVGAWRAKSCTRGAVPSVDPSDATTIWHRRPYLGFQYGCETRLVSGRKGKERGLDTVEVPRNWNARKMRWGSTKLPQDPPFSTGKQQANTLVRASTLLSLLSQSQTNQHKMSSAPPPAAAAAPAGGAAAPAPAASAASASGAAAPAPAAAAPKGSKSKKSSSKTATKASGAGTQAKKKTNTQRKRKPTKAASAASQQLIANDARAAAAHLSQEQANSLAKRTDPLWYRMEDVIPANMTANDAKKTGVVEEFQALENALHSQGKTRADITPQALACLMEHIRRYRQELVAAAKKYAEAAGRTEVTKPDLQLAAELRHDHPVALSSQLPKLHHLAEQVNRKPLPPIPDTYSGIKLPLPPHQVTARTFDVLSGAATQHKMESPLPRPPKATGQQGSYGAIRGRQIPVKIKATAALEPSPAATPPPPSAGTAAPAAGSSSTPTGPIPMDTSASPSTPPATSETATI